MSPARREDDHLEVGVTWEDLVERKIREAQDRGDFDNLPGHGRPLKLEQNVYAGDWELSYKILKDHGFAPPWVEASREMDEAIESVRRAADALKPSPSADRARARQAFLEQVEATNAMIDRFNLHTPFPWTQRTRLSLEREAQRFDLAWPPQ